MNIWDMFSIFSHTHKPVHVVTNRSAKADNKSILRKQWQLRVVHIFGGPLDPDRSKATAWREAGRGFALTFEPKIVQANMLAQETRLLRV